MLPVQIILRTLCFAKCTREHPKSKQIGISFATAERILTFCIRGKIHDCVSPWPHPNGLTQTPLHHRNLDPQNNFDRLNDTSKNIFALFARNWRHIVCSHVCSPHLHWTYRYTRLHVMPLAVKFYAKVLEWHIDPLLPFVRSRVLTSWLSRHPTWIRSLCIHIFQFWQVFGTTQYTSRATSTGGLKIL